MCEGDCGHKTYRLWLTWWEFPSRSTLSKNPGWSSHSWKVQWPGELGLLGDDWVSNEGWTSLVSGATPKEGSILVRFALVCLCLYKFVVNDCAVCSESVMTVVVLLLNSNNNSYSIVEDDKEGRCESRAQLFASAHCADVPCGVNRQCYGILVLHLKPLNVKAHVYGEEIQVFPV